MFFHADHSISYHENLEVQLDGGLDGKFVFNTDDSIGKGNFGSIFKGLYISIIRTRCSGKLSLINIVTF